MRDAHEEHTGEIGKTQRDCVADLFVSGGRYTAEGGFEVDALKTLFEGKVEVKR